MLLVCLAGALVFGSCSPTEQARKDDRESTDENSRKDRPLLIAYESTFRPSDYDAPVEEVLRTHSIRRQIIQVESEGDSVVLETEYLQGFRIQIFATASIDEANAMKTTASQIITGDSLYVVFDPPVYKVRVGDFPSRIEAGKKLTSLVDKGFPDAWVVNDRIMQRKYVRVKQ